MSLLTRRALIFGASGGLASAMAAELLAREFTVSLVTRDSRKAEVERTFADALTAGRARIVTVERRYTEYKPVEDAAYDLVVFTQALFQPTPLTEMGPARVADEIAIGLTDQIQLTQAILHAHPPAADQRVDFCFTGSTSSYAGFAGTTVYCAVKHGLLGFVRAMNDEFAGTSTRFWLASMGSMDTEMGHNVPKQDRATFLQAHDVARRVVDAVTDASNMFEPEILIRRRILRKTN